MDQRKLRQFPAQQFILDLWAHLPTQNDEVTSLALEFFRDRRLGLKAGIAVARDAVLSVVLILPSLRVKDPTDTIFWAGIPVYASFIVEVPADVAVGSRSARFARSPGRTHPVNHWSIAGVDQVDAHVVTADLTALPVEC